MIALDTFHVRMVTLLTTIWLLLRVTYAASAPFIREDTTNTGDEVPRHLLTGSLTSKTKKAHNHNNSDKPMYSYEDDAGPIFPDAHGESSSDSHAVYRQGWTWGTSDDGRSESSWLGHLVCGHRLKGSAAGSPSQERNVSTYRLLFGPCQQNQIQRGQAKTVPKSLSGGSGSVSDGTGWTPDSYPNPLQDPAGCHISALITGLGDRAASHLLLCDPDSVLQGQYPQQIADAIRNFSFPIPPSTFLPCFRKLRNRLPNLPPSRPLNATLTDKENEEGTRVAIADLFSDVLRDEKWIVSRRGEKNLKASVSLAEIQVAVAIVEKIDLQAILRGNSFYSYEDENDMINDAAQYFARYLHDAWEVGSDTCGQTGILIFLSIKDRVCYISTGTVVETVIPWWRLEYVVSDMKTDLRHKRYGDSILRAIADMRVFMEQGPPTLSDRAKDFIKRFGVVIAFAVFTFAFAFWGEYRDRFRRWQYTERRSKLSPSERVQAKHLQESYRCRACPICLEEFSQGKDSDKSGQRETACNDEKIDSTNASEHLPLLGSDGLPLKLLRCGHVFDQSCWRCWVKQGSGNPWKCPVCRQDIGGKSTSASHRRAASEGSALNTRIQQGSLVNRSRSHPTYESANEASGGRRHRHRRNATLGMFRMNYGTLAAHQHMSLLSHITEEQQGLLSELDIPTSEVIDFQSEDDADFISRHTQSSDSLESLERGR